MLVGSTPSAAEAMSPTEFGELFARSADVYAAIKSVVDHSRERGEPIDAAEVVRQLSLHYPDVTPAKLLEEVVKAAAEAGVTLKIGKPDAKSL